METANNIENGNAYIIMRHSLPSNGPSQSFDNLIRVNSRAAIFKKRNFYRKVSIGLAIVIFFLIIAFFIALYDYLNARSEVSKLRRIQLCSSEECLRSAANIRLSMDTKTDPCDDFYKFTCGRWTKEHPNHGWYPHYSSFETVDERIAIAALDSLKLNNSASEPLPVRQSRDFYTSCMDTDTLDKLGYTVLINYLKEVNLPVIPNFFNDKSDKYTFDWIKTEVNLKKTFAMDTLIGLLVDSDIYNRSNNVIYFGTPGSACPLPSPIKSENKNKKKMEKRAKLDTEREKEKAEAYKRIVKRVIKVILLNESNTVPTDELLEEAASTIWNFTKDLEELTDMNSTNDIVFYKMKVSELQNITDRYLQHNNQAPTFQWKYYLTLLFDGIPNVTLDLENADLLYIPEEELPYLPELALYLANIPDLALELYMWWITVYTMILSTTSELTNLLAEETSAFTSINTVYRSRSLDCASLVINFMGIAVSHEIADKAFLTNTQPKVQQMLDDIKDAFVERVNEINWMDKETKKATLEKSKEMISFIGFPEWILDNASLELYYANITIHNNTFLENMMGMIKTVTPSMLETLREESERTWRTDPTTVNAYNYFSDNSITVPMAILTYPFYNLGLEVLNYGAIGSILGHELTHGFDNIGRKFDKYGNYKQWWSNKTILTFENKTNCFVSQYGNYSLPAIEEAIDGEKTLGENLADNGGLHHAYLAYKNYLKKNGEEKKLPGFEEYSHYQMFYIAFGSIWCETPDIAALKFQVKHDEHSPSSLRVLGSLQNSNDFAKAFQCPVGSNMNPKRKRCRIW